MSTWIAASKILGRPVSTEEPYPHICCREVPADQTVSGRPVRMVPKNCAACAEEEHQRNGGAS